MRPRRFLVTRLGDDSIVIEAGEAAHAERVLRMRAGDAVVVFDGTGAEVDGRIERVDRGRLIVRPTGPIRLADDGWAGLTLAVAAPKGERADWMIEKCAELGVAAIRLIVTERGAVTPGAGKLERWRRKAIEAAKQAGLSRVMAVDGPMPIGEAADSRWLLLLGDPSPAAESFVDRLEGLRAGEAHAARVQVMVYIGPEGGFTEAESAELASLGAIGVRLAPSILRIETAAVATAAVFAGVMRDDGAWPRGSIHMRTQEEHAD
ncbi:MAG: 16S rRNA (uracil(1498)-N(3))-methyltransferase [Phycisphaerae bacterium]|nr:16S rRNA (uracil(1498)-N(3))-methyltransferase [Phycisphaerae bacterium]